MTVLTRWREQRRQKRLLTALVEEFKTPIGLLPLGDQDSDSDPVWQMTHFTPDNFPAQRTKFTQVIESLIRITAQLPDIRIPVDQFYGSSGGKSGPRRSLRDFAYHTMQENGSIGFKTDAHWEENTRSFDTRFKSKAPTAYLFNWSQRLYLRNGDQSHHFAALYRQSLDQSRKWQVPCNLEIYDWNQSIQEVSNTIQFIARNGVDSVWHHMNKCSVRIQHVALGRSGLGLHAIQVSNFDSEVMSMVLNTVLELESRGLIIRFSQIKDLLRFEDTPTPH